tara:strand:- start:44771 stop:45724 length:954 start_codon:yes stop_codon:yes gene_type:complete
MIKFFYIKLRNFKNKIRNYFFLRKYRKDTPDSTWKFYNKMRYIYRNEFKKRENFSKILSNTKHIDTLTNKGFVILKLSDVSKKKEFNDKILEFKKKYNDIVKDLEKNIHKKNYLIQYNFEFNKDIKIVADPFVDIATKYLGTLPILDSFQMWFSPNKSYELEGSKLLHRDPEDFKQLKIFIPVEEIQTNNGPLNVIDKKESKLLYEDLMKKKIISHRNQKIEDKYARKLNLTNHKILLKNNECALVDTCASYHFGSRKSSKPRKLIFLHFTTAFSAKTPIFRSYDSDKKFSLDKDKLVYGLQKKTINHYRNRKYLKI